MVAPVTGTSQSSMYAIAMTYVLILLALWEVDLGLAVPSSWHVSGGNIPAAVNLPSEPLHTPETLLQKLRVTEANADETDTRRIATVALMLYAGQDGIKK